MKDTLKIGNRTFLKVQLSLFELGYDVFVPCVDGCKIDCIAVKDGKTTRIQVKTSRLQDGKLVFNGYATSRTRSKSDSKKVLYTKEDIDCFATMDDLGKLYLIPIEDVQTQTVIVERHTDCILQ